MSIEPEFDQKRNDLVGEELRSATMPSSQDRQMAEAFESLRVSTELGRKFYEACKDTPNRELEAVLRSSPVQSCEVFGDTQGEPAFPKRVNRRSELSDFFGRASVEILPKGFALSFGLCFISIRAGLISTIATTGASLSFALVERYLNGRDKQ